MNKLFSFINGKDSLNENGLITLADIEGSVWGGIVPASHWEIEAAVETAGTVQKELSGITTEEIFLVLKKVAEIFGTEEDYNTIVRLTGSPYSFVSEAMEEMKKWFDGKIIGLLENAFPKGICPRQSSPVVAVLPSNSEQELLYIAAQVMLSGNALIIRPSSRGASAYAAGKFVRCISDAVDSFNDERLEPLKRAVQVVHTDRNFLNQLAVDGWNYIIFGDEQSVKDFEKDLRERSAPRKVVSYGTGLSTAVVAEGARLVIAARQILESVALNRGDECVSTDIVYAHESVTPKLLEYLAEGSAKFQNISTFEKDSLGIVGKENCEFIRRELCLMRGKQINDFGNGIGLSIVIMRENETTMEYPGPILSVRSYSNNEHLKKLIDKDLKDNNMTKSLKTSVYAGSTAEFDKILPLTRAYTVLYNMPTHQMDLNELHQGVYLIKELSDEVLVVN